MNREGMGWRIRAQVVEEPLRAGWLKEDFFSAFAAEGDEEPARADVSIEREAGVFVPESCFHAVVLVARIVMQVREKGHYCRVGEKFLFSPWLTPGRAHLKMAAT
jgi:hypothetical protein